jgi:hypothetical protein
LAKVGKQSTFLILICPVVKGAHPAVDAPDAPVAKIRMSASCPQIMVAATMVEPCRPAATA